MPEGEKDLIPVTLPTVIRPRIVAFDLSTTHVGAASNAHDDGGPPLAWHWDLSGGSRPVRLASLARYLISFFNTTSKTLNVVVYERPFARGLAATRGLWGAAGLLEAIATDYGLDVRDASVGEIKKFACHGGATKTEMIAAAQAMGYEGDNEHEADAYCLLKFAEVHLKYVPPGDEE